MATSIAAPAKAIATSHPSTVRNAIAASMDSIITVSGLITVLAQPTTNGSSA